jgi:hypothetical protein
MLFSEYSTRKDIASITDVKLGKSQLSFTHGAKRVKLSITGTPDVHAAIYGAFLADPLTDSSKGTLAIDSSVLTLVENTGVFTPVFNAEGKQTNKDKGSEIPALSAIVTVLGTDDTALALYASRFYLSPVTVTGATKVSKKTVAKLARFDAFLAQ